MPILNPSDRELTLRQGQKIAFALPAFTELINMKQDLIECVRDDCKECNMKYKQNLHHVKSVCSSMTTLNGSTPSGRSNFPAKDELEKNCVAPKLGGVEGPYYSSSA